MFAQISHVAGRWNFQAGHAGSIPVIRSHGSRAAQRRYPMVCRVNQDAHLGAYGFQRLEVASAEVVVPAQVAPPEVAATKVAATGVAYAEVSAAEVSAAIPGIAVVVVVYVPRRVPVAEQAGTAQGLAEQEAGKHTTAKTEAAPVRRGEAGVDVLNLVTGPVLDHAHRRLVASLDDPLAVVARRDRPARAAIRGCPGQVGHRHAMARIEEAHRAAARLGLTVRDGLGAGQPILALANRPADGSHVRWLAGRVQRMRSALVRVQCGSLFGRR